MMRTSQTQRDEAIELGLEVGAAEAARRLDMNVNTLRSWMSRSGRSPNPGQMAAAGAAKLAGVVERKAKLADDLLDDAQRLRAQLFAPAVERKAMVVSDGPTIGSHAEVVDIDLDHPTFADQRQIMTSIAIAVDKIQILTGDATQRVETLDGANPRVGERRQRATAVIDELAARRAG